MMIAKIIWATLILFVYCIIQGLSVLIKGLSRLFGKIAEYLEMLGIKLLSLGEPKKEKKQPINIDVPL